MAAIHLKCMRCEREYAADVRYQCDACGGILAVRYDELHFPSPDSPDALSVWKYRALLPIGENASVVSLDEGGTPLRAAKRLGKRLDCATLWLKDETVNPTGSFKDRPMMVGVSKAVEFGATGVIAATSGNAGSSLAAYAAQAGLPCVVLVPERTSSEKIAQARVYGAQVVAVRGNFSAAYSLACEFTMERGWINLTTTFINPYTVEGDKTIAYEIFEQLGRIVPDWVIVPVGAGPLLVGIFKGFAELERMGLAARTPRMVGVQATGCAPVVQSFESKSEIVQAWGDPSTLALGISDPLQGYTQDGTLALQTIRRSGGTAIAVSDGVILEAVHDLARAEGIFAEPAGAAPIAALKLLLQTGQIRRDKSVACIVTGHGLKDPQVAIESVEPILVEPELHMLEITIARWVERVV